MIKKVGSVVLGLSVIGIVALGYNSSFTPQASHADFPAPKNPDLAYDVDLNKGDGGAPSNTHADHFVSKPDLA
ncbi:Phr family secreted Rap phosphatase inhibitor [Bacillus sp. 166amftsu]|uniref:Phr family secreted Rap phosphatase inhibitor n=1 Tax=Bacillus sp. 166amftsu TaxID=1761753 RepID=UPI000896A5E0|nr:Phr family secreted Rap phosphatase inhibitor [Bacillus sp. 166amftsu]SDZ08145.1 Phr family secreted Rap phosphatase inhibitor [Bacillus sp. 166amftsu]